MNLLCWNDFFVHHSSITFCWESVVTFLLFKKNRIFPCYWREKGTQIHAFFAYAFFAYVKVLSEPMKFLLNIAIIRNWETAQDKVKNLWPRRQLNPRPLHLIICCSSDWTMRLDGSKSLMITVVILAIWKWMVCIDEWWSCNKKIDAVSIIMGLKGLKIK